MYYLGGTELLMEDGSVLKEELGVAREKDFMFLELITLKTSR